MVEHVAPVRSMSLLQPADISPQEVDNFGVIEGRRIYRVLVSQCWILYNNASDIPNTDYG